MKFGQYLVEQGIVDEETIIQVLSIQRRRNLIPIGEIAMQKHLLNAKQLFEVLNRQEETGEQFGETACTLGYLDQDQLLQLLTIQRSIHGTIGSILVELKKVDQQTLDDAWKEFHAIDKHAPIPAKTIELAQETRSKVPVQAKSTQPDQSLFTKTSLACPVCEHQEEHCTIIPSAYRKTKYDIDLKPSEYSWLNVSHETINPALYDTWQCSQCRFAANNRYFKNVTREISISPFNFAKKVKRAYKKDELQELNEIQSQEQGTYANAFLKLYTAIAIYQNVQAIAEKDALPLANHYHHLAWLFRELATNDIADSERETITALIKQIQEIIPEMPSTETKALLKALDSYNTAYFESSLVENEGLAHITQQVMGRIHIYLGNLPEAEIQLKEASKTAEFKIKCINEKLEHPTDQYSNQATLNNEKNRLTTFLMDTVELFKYLTE